MTRKTVSGIMLTLLFIGMLTLAFKIQPVKAERTWTVDDDGLADFHTIQEAIDAASPTDTIYVHSGTYYENVIVNKNDLTFFGENRETTIIHGISGETVTTLYVEANNTIITGFTTQNGGVGIQVYRSSNVSIYHNNASNNLYDGIVVGGSSNVSVYNNNVNNNPVRGGIELGASYNSSVYNNNANNNAVGVFLGYSFNNSIYNNTLTNNYNGIWTFGPSDNNKIYHNNFINNTNQAYPYDSINVWDDGYPSGGNYWSDYNGTDIYSGPNQDQFGSDGICDKPYDIAYMQYVDRYPLMNPCGPDFTPPATLHDYDGLWHTSDFTITLSATDDLSGVAETYYIINNGSTQNVTAYGQPLIITESANNKLEYWSVDNSDNEELPHKILTGIKLDKTYPTVEAPSRTPDGDVLPDESVKVSVNVTDATSQVKNVTLYYTTDNGNTWTDLPMNHTAQNLYEAIIPLQQAGTTVRFRIVAYDQAGNNATLDGTQPYCVYQVVPEFSSFLVLPLFIMATLLTVIVHVKRGIDRSNRKTISDEAT